MAGCGEPQEEIVPYVEMPERRVPAGEPLRFATALALSGYGRGVVAISVDGRPIKIEGNPRHPYSLGATDLFAEAEILGLYDPDRSRAPLQNATVASWQEFESDWLRWTANDRSGAGMGLVTGRVTSPTLLRLITALKMRFPELRQYRYEPAHDDEARAGSRQAFGRQLESIPHLDRADVVLCLDADPLGAGPGLLRNARDFATRRSGGAAQRLYVAEPAWTLTGAAADHRIAAHPDAIAEMARAVAKALGADAGEPMLSPAALHFAETAASDLRQANGRAIILVGNTQPAALHALAHFLNGQLQAPVDLVAPSDPVEDDHTVMFSAFINDLQQRKIRTLIVLDANPVYDSAARDEVGRALSAVPFSVHVGCYGDETAEHCRWHLPLSHTLESWGDIRSVDGTAALIQPLIRPLYDTRTAPEILNLLAGGRATGAQQLLRASWMAAAPSGMDMDQWWLTSLTTGVTANSATSSINATAAMPSVPPARNSGFGLSLLLSPSPTIWDGRYCNNAWLQECPSPFSKEVWGNAIEIAPEDAARLGVSEADHVTVGHGRAEVQAIATIERGQAPGTIRASLGYGRWRAGTIGSGVGTRFTALTMTGQERRLDGISLRRTGSGLLHSTQSHTKLEGRDEELYPLAPASQITERIAALKPDRGGMLPPLPPDPYAWAMVIDNDLCIGCNACVIACQAENNVGVVGPDQVDLGREMHWLRIDTYELDVGDGLRRGFQPIPCMHCETAPCEPVCPVEASVHDHEGLNVQVYNRCIGTRFCEANCPYKVRRFNFFAYTRGQEYGNLGEPPVRAQRNPNVSVRGRGVMEKCTYCVQRISSARKQAEKQDRLIREGEVVTACAAACPTRAIRFGNRNDPQAAVATLKHNERHFELLGHLDTRPRTTYLAKVYNPNPALGKVSG